MDRLRLLGSAGAVMSIVAALTGCTSSADKVETPGLEPRGTVLTTVKPTRQNLTNRIALTGKVTINPIFGIVAPSGGELRYLQRRPSATAPTTKTWVATVWHDGEPRKILLPENSTLVGRLMDDRATVTAGMPIVSARHAGYGIVADIDSALAYRISGAAKSVQAQIKSGPGPFRCTPLGTIAALPAGTIPEPPPVAPSTPPSGQPDSAKQPEQPQAQTGGEGSEATGLRLVCTAPGDVKLINGATVTLDVVTDKATHVLVLPVEAIAGVQGKGKVDVVGPDRTRKTVDVVLGLTDGKVVEIKSGLKGTENVAIPGPDLPAGPAGNQDPNGQSSGAPG